MPFGLTNAPATFQRLMNGVLRGLTWMTCLVYLDDIVIFTKGGIERHIVELASVLERLKSAGLSLKLKKCTFATTSMEYLGHMLSDEGVRPVDRLVTAVREFSRPLDSTEVKRFVHLAGYYRKFMAGFGSIVEPLTRLLKKDVDWEWTEAQEFAFARVKMLLTTQPLLLYPNFELPFRLVTDASKVGLGACLQQDHGRGWQPIAFASKVNNRAESNYSITELECAAVVWSVKLFRPYLYGRTFTIVTDHAALRWLMTRPNLAGRLHRWSLTLQEYEFNIVYRPGATNVVADTLSRAPAVVLAAVGRQKRRIGSRATCTAAHTAVTNGVVQDNNNALVTTATSDEVRMIGTSESTDEVDMPTVSIPDTAGETTMVVRLNDGAVRNSTAVSNNGSLSAVDHGLAVAPTDGTHGASDEQVTREGRLGDGLINDAAPSAVSTTNAVDSSLVSVDGAVSFDGVRPTSVDAGMAVMDALGNTTATEVVTNDCRRRRAHRQRQSRMEGGERERRGIQPRDGRTNVQVTASAKSRTEKPLPMASRTDEESATAGVKTKATASVPTPATKKKRVPPGTKRSTIMSATNGVNMDDDVLNDGVESTPGYEYTLQLSDDEVVAAQKSSKFVKRLVTAGKHGNLNVESRFGLVVVETANGWRVVLPPTLWTAVFKEMHGSVWSGHLRGPHTYGRVAQLYWWPGLRKEVNKWVRGCQECGSRKAKPRQVIPPLRSLRGGAVCDRWALEVAGPFPVADGGDRYVIAAVEYVTRYAVASCVKQHTAENVATFLMEEVILKFGVFRELLTDGAPEMAGKVIEVLVEMLQARQVNPVPYRPQLIGLVERFHRSWKDCVATFMQDTRQTDWNLWVKFAVYSYNAARHSTVALTN
ncbi:LOW QUALITY PROTEIN: Enzymatic Polyprotein, partial [Phytophthora megakarya]